MKIGRIIMRILSVERLKDQGSNGSIAYEWATKIALEKTFRPNILRSRTTALVPPFRKIVAHTWSSSYLLRNSGAHYRKAMRLLSKLKNKTASDWVGSATWGSPIVALAPPQVNWTRRKSARLSITKGAREAMISYPNINEIKNVIHKARSNPQAA